jgi:transposase
MDTIEMLKEDLKEGRISAERLVDLVADLCRKLEAANQRIEELNQRIEELEKQCGGTPTAKVEEPFSTRAEEQRQEARGKKRPKRKLKGRRGRVSTNDKVALAERTESVFPEGVPPDACRVSHVRPVWRLENGRAVLVAYQVYRGPGNRYGQIPGVLGRSEYGLEIVTEIAYLIYLVGLSFDKVCQLLDFFQVLRLRKSQANTLLYQLSRDWEREFDVLCTLLANSLVVHADETRWSLNSVWAFLSEKARVVLFGVPKDAGTLQKVLDPASFAGILISDDAAVYAHFTRSQKCWAHLLRKAIKLTLQAPNHAAYRTFTDRLLEIYRAACRVQRDGRHRDAGRARKVRALDDEILDLCVANWLPDQPPSNGLDKDYRLLVSEVLRLLLRQELLTFVTARPTEQPNGATKPVDGTNNEAERTLRGAAQARLTGRTSKTINGARRQTILTSVLQSLRLYLPTFTLSSVLAELKRWWATGRSCFAELLETLSLTPPEQSVVDLIFLGPSG